MINMQVAVDENLLAEIEKAGERQGLDLAQIVGEALHSWLKRRDGLRREGLRFEQEWITSLKKNPDDSNRAEEPAIAPGGFDFGEMPDRDWSSPLAKTRLVR